MARLRDRKLDVAAGGAAVRAIVSIAYKVLKVHSHLSRDYLGRGGFARQEMLAM